MEVDGSGWHGLKWKTTLIKHGVSELAAVLPVSGGSGISGSINGRPTTTRTVPPAAPVSEKDFPRLLALKEGALSARFSSCFRAPDFANAGFLVPKHRRQLRGGSVSSGWETL